MDNIRKMYLIQFLNGFFLVGALAVPFFVDWAKLTLTQALFLDGWMMLWIVLLEVPTGAFADRFSRKSSIIFSGIAAAVACIVYASTTNFYVFMFGEILFALGISLTSGADNAIIYDTLLMEKREKHVKKAFGNCEIANSLGHVIALPLGSLLAAANFWPYPASIAFVFMLTAVPNMIAALIAITLVEPKIKRHLDYFKLIKSGWQSFKKHKAMKILALDFIVIGTLCFTMFWLWQAMALKLGLAIAYFGFIGAAINVAAMLLINKTKWLEKTFGPRNLILLSAIIPAFMFFMVGFAPAIITLVVSTLAILGFKIMRDPLMKYYLNRFMRSEERATVNSIISMLSRLSLFIAMPLAGMAADWSLENIFIILGAIIIVFVVFSRIGEEMLD